MYKDKILSKDLWKIDEISWIDFEKSRALNNKKKTNTKIRNGTKKIRFSFGNGRP